MVGFQKEEYRFSPREKMEEGVGIGGHWPWAGLAGGGPWRFVEGYLGRLCFKWRNYHSWKLSL